MLFIPLPRNKTGGFVMFTCLRVLVSQTKIYFQFFCSNSVFFFEFIFILRQNNLRKHRQTENTKISKDYSIQGYIKYLLMPTT
jgi:hypothetical protein